MRFEDKASLVAMSDRNESETQASSATKKGSHLMTPLLRGPKSYRGKKERQQSPGSSDTHVDSACL